MNPIELSLFSSRIEAVCDELGVVLQRSAFSPNIKDRLDYSCAVFCAQGHLVAQAAHIPVHPGSMACAMQDLVARFVWLTSCFALSPIAPISPSLLLRGGWQT